MTHSCGDKTRTWGEQITDFSSRSQPPSAKLPTR
jgi:hypothetical protein